MNFLGGISFAAGVLTTVSPCVLPILPMLLGSSVQKKKSTPAYMVLGLMLSFVFFGVIISRFGGVLGLNEYQLRMSAALMLIVGGSILFSKKLQLSISSSLTKLADIGNRNALKLKEDRPWGALGLGALLGIIWSPCVGPTLGVAITLAGQEAHIGSAAAMMSLYALGAGLPMILIAYSSRELVTRLKPGMINFAENSKPVFGLLLVISGVFIISGLDKIIESMLLNMLPQFWLDAITNL